MIIINIRRVIKKINIGINRIKKEILLVFVIVESSCFLFKIYFIGKICYRDYFVILCMVCDCIFLE